MLLFLSFCVCDVFFTDALQAISDSFRAGWICPPWPCLVNADKEPTVDTAAPSGSLADPERSHSALCVIVNDLVPGQFGRGGPREVGLIANEPRSLPGSGHPAVHFGGRPFGSSSGCTCPIEVRDHGPVASASFCLIERIVGALDHALDVLVRLLASQLGDANAQGDAGRIALTR